jgi:hypothetical protein
MSLKTIATKKLVSLVGFLGLAFTPSFLEASEFQCRFDRRSQNFAVPDLLTIVKSEASNSIRVRDTVTESMGLTGVSGEYSLNSDGNTKLSWTLSNIPKAMYYKLTKQNLGNRFVYSGSLNEATGQIRLIVRFPTEWGNKTAIQRVRGRCQKI